DYQPVDPASVYRAQSYVTASLTSTEKSPSARSFDGRDRKFPRVCPESPSEHIQRIHIGRKLHAGGQTKRSEHCSKEVMQRRGVGRLKLKMKPIIPFEPIDRRFRRAQQTHGSLW